MATDSKNLYMVQLHRIAVLILEAAEILPRILSKKSANMEALALRIRDKTAEGRLLSRGLIDKMNRALIKPLDQDCIREGSKALRVMMVSLEKLASDSTRLQIHDAVPLGDEISKTIFHQSREIAAALSGMRNGSGPVEHCKEVIRLGAEVHRLQESSILHILETANDPLQALKCKQVVDDLHNTAKAARYLAFVLISDLHRQGLSC
jgi:uncharacterized protein Yka (UPF0111/DUF47 family)